MESEIESVAVKGSHKSDSAPAPQDRGEGAATSCRRARGARVLKAGLYATVAVCLATTLVHVVLVFLHVAPANSISKSYSAQVNSWVYPLFEQNWRLFAPEPDSVNRKILARTAHAGPDGSVKVSRWFDLSALDNSAVEHNVFPSHTTQNLLRRAWASYLESHGGDDRARSERAAMMESYLRNIAVDRVAAHRGGTFDFIQLRVVTLPIAPPGAAAGNRPPTPVETRLLPWWKVTPRGK